MKTEIVKENLSEKEAFDFEKELIHHYVFDLGYSIDIAGLRKPDTNHVLTNQTLGGEGQYGTIRSEEWKKQHSQDMTGEKNPMYGINLWNTFSEEKKQRLREQISFNNTGKKNAMYGVSPKDRMSKEKYEIWKTKVCTRTKSQTGDKNPNYHNDTLKKKLEANPELKILYYSRKGNKNGRATKVSLYRDDQYIKTFDYITLCAEWIKQTLNLNSKLSTILSGISTSVKNNKPYHGFTFKYITNIHTHDNQLPSLPNANNNRQEGLETRK